MQPTARRADVIIQPAGSDLLVYDQLRDAAHSLSPVTGYVFRHADGTKSLDELSSGLAQALGVSEAPELVAAALSELERVHLLERTAGNGLMTRRAAVRRFGTAALALATISSIAAPTPAMARSWGSTGSSKGRGPDGQGPPGQRKKDGESAGKKNGKGRSNGRGKTR